MAIATIVMDKSKEFHELDDMYNNRLSFADGDPVVLSNQVYAMSIKKADFKTGIKVYNAFKDKVNSLIHESIDDKEFISGLHFASYQYLSLIHI